MVNLSWTLEHPSRGGAVEYYGCMWIFDVNENTLKTKINVFFKSNLKDLQKTSKFFENFVQVIGASSSCYQRFSKKWETLKIQVDFIL